MSYIHDSLYSKIDQLKRNWEYEQALDLVNWILKKDPTNDQALLEVADIQYMRWEISKAEKPIDFILSRKWDKDPMSLYVKWVLEMEKTNWDKSKLFLRKALDLSNSENPEILRCYWLSEYWSWNREKWISFIVQAFEVNSLDAEIIYNLVEINLLENKYEEAKVYIDHYYRYHDTLETFWNDLEFYDQKISLFEKYLDK